MKKAILSGLRWGMDAGFLLTMSWFLVILFYTGLDSIGVGLWIATESFPFWCVLPLLIGAIIGAVFSFILVKFHPGRGKYILFCTLLGMSPVYPFMIRILLFNKTNDLSDIPSITTYYILYLITCIVLSNYIYQHIKPSPDAPSTSS